MVSSKIPTSKKNAFTTILGMAEEVHAIDLAIPMSNLVCPEKLIDLVSKNMRLGNNDYSPAEGVEQLREQIINLVNQQNNTLFNPETDITITAGPAQAMTTAISTFVKEGDEALIFEPIQESYAPFIELNGGRPIFVNLKMPDFRIDWEEVKKLVTSKTKMIIINNPQNPIGRIFSEEDIVQLKRLTNGTKLVILSNEVFDHIVFDDLKFHSLASIPELASKSLIVSSFGPVFNITGWGIGYIYGPEKLMSEFRKIQQFQGFSVNTPAQFALAEFLQDGPDFEAICETYHSKRDLFIKLLEGSNFVLVPIQSTFYQILDFSKISDESDIEFATRLIREYGVATVPFSAFQHEKTKNQLIRICFAKPDEVLKAAAKKLKSVPVGNNH
ncbi:MAG: aminotransferase class I/II-fold pyridoxal phosphate-dependent enzyme [Bacteroidia bacterium]|nr:aminotransferase class I/II-fold pyridoxal phosphate-dependent enzyme [Bacteroidia bacterium]